MAIIRQPKPVVYSKNPVEFEWQTSGTDTWNFKIYVGGVLQATDQYKTVGPSLQNIIFDASTVLDAYMEANNPVQFPENFSIRTDGLAYKQTTKGIVAYSVEILQNASIMYTFNGKCILGGKNLEEIEAGINPFGRIITALTNQNNALRTTKEQAQYLYFYAKNDIEVTLYINVKFADASTQLISHTGVELSDDNIHIFDVSFARIVANDQKPINLPESEVSSIEIYMAASGVESLKYLYTIDRAYYMQKYYFIFQNTAGGYDSVFFSGYQTNEIQADRDIAKNDDGKESIFGMESIRNTDIETGYKPFREIEYLMEFLQSRKIIELDGDIKKEVILDTKKIKNKYDKPGLKSLSFSYHSASAYNGYINGISTPDENIAFTSISIEVISPTQINLTWIAGNLSGGGIEYEIYRSLNAETGFSLVATVSTLFYNDTSLTQNTTYYYKIRAKQGATFYEYSDPKTATTPEIVASVGTPPTMTYIPTFQTGLILYAFGQGLSNNPIGTLIEIWISINSGAYTLIDTYVTDFNDDSIPGYSSLAVEVPFGANVKMKARAKYSISLYSEFSSELEINT